VKHIHNYEDFLKWKPQLTGEYIVQEALTQSEKMSQINPSAINTIRAVTVNTNGKPCLLSALLRVGTKKSGNVDNWAAGGLAVGIDMDGRLKQFGMYKPCYGGKATVHPDTGISFIDFTVPQYKEAVDLCLMVHSCLKGIHTIGWDIAITDDGPFFIEGNDNLEISLMQACDRPLKIEWKKMLNKNNG